MVSAEVSIEISPIDTTDFPKVRFLDLLATNVWARADAARGRAILCWVVRGIRTLGARQPGA